MHLRPSSQIAKRVADGERADVAIVTADALDKLIAEGKVMRGSGSVIAHSAIGLAVPAGAPRPDISTAERFREAMLAAKSIATSNPVGGGQSGVFVQQAFERLGIADAVKPKLIYGSGGPAGLIGFFLVRGEAEIGLQQMPELMAVDGIDVVGPLPDGAQSVTVFAVGTLAGAADPDGARAFASFLRTPQARTVLKAKGLDPA